MTEMISKDEIMHKLHALMEFVNDKVIEKGGYKEAEAPIYVTGLFNASIAFIEDDGIVEIDNDRLKPLTQEEAESALMDLILFVRRKIENRIFNTNPALKKMTEIHFIIQKMIEMSMGPLFGVITCLIKH
jgi:hypothetical protein